VLPGERRRERVITPEEEARYLAAAPEPLASIATVLADTGTRPEECFRLCWENVTWLNGRNGAMLVTHGKTAAARRVIPMTPRVRAVLGSRWEAAGKPEEGFVWPAQTRSGHVEPSSLRKQHAKAFKIIGDESAKRSQRPVRPFVLYSLRHTFLDPAGAIRLRRVDTGTNRWTQLYRHFGPIRPPLRRCCLGRDFPLGWAQNWAHSKRSPSVAGCERSDKHCTVNQLQATRP